MKVVQMNGDMVHWDATPLFPTLGSTVGRFPPSDVFMEVPDHVDEGWRYVDGEFIPPPPVDDGPTDAPENENVEVIHPVSEFEQLRADVEQNRADIDFFSAITGIGL